MPLAYMPMILSSSSLVLAAYLFTNCGSKSPLRSRGTWIVVSPSEERTFFMYFPLRLFPEFLPLASYGSYPRCSLNSASSICSSVLANNRANMPSFPKKSSIDFAVANSRCTSSAPGMISCIFSCAFFFSDIVYSPKQSADYSLPFTHNIVHPRVNRCIAHVSGC